MQGFDLLLSNLIQPIVLSFLLGTLAGAVKSELELPDAVVKLLAIYLLFSLGITGGRELAKADLASLGPMIGITLFMTFGIPSLAYLITRRLGQMDVSNAAAIAAHYGSVSTATFFASMSFASSLGTPADGYIAAMVAFMEFGVIYALVIARVVQGRASPNQSGTSALFMSVIRGRGILLLVGGMTIGYLSNDKQWQQIAPFFESLFRGMLMLFLLEMGITAARSMAAFRQVGIFMAGFGTIMPVVHGILGVTLAYYAGMSQGSSFVFGAICASASFIDAPAACRASLPQANPGIYLTSSLGVTLPFNLLIGLPTYYSYAAWLQR
ncbi:MAG: sodium-dependent bicarbonate transport family permease [Betaproteobacteria bacterium]|nr:sodium-dependent bicarbonate transport family permease [Betaproteobacteria bacterium]NBS40540.1 sodium-dependent bicarbonate transport family permease [Betaproteobacteria bacterium]NBT06416.1 sodium-dependent bicarbonate transport family permease [Betaproteobacteria bacterium]NCU95633.1 sodium-dependent bicarbonate transport family permease [Betaproteobacteria bacterium]NCY08522.1 sodium-dependent bicarbonate transport family permease [Betaproteobacteria bacterium]